MEARRRPLSRRYSPDEPSAAPRASHVLLRMVGRHTPHDSPEDIRPPAPLSPRCSKEFRLGRLDSAGCAPNGFDNVCYENRPPDVVPPLNRNCLNSSTAPKIPHEYSTRLKWFEVSPRLAQGATLSSAQKKRTAPESGSTVFQRDVGDTGVIRRGHPITTTDRRN